MNRIRVSKRDITQRIRYLRVSLKIFTANMLCNSHEWGVMEARIKDVNDEISYLLRLYKHLTGLICTA